MLKDRVVSAGRLSTLSARRSGRSPIGVGIAPDAEASRPTVESSLLVSASAFGEVVDEGSLGSVGVETLVQCVLSVI
jgi:hypothetical protein